MRGQRRRFERLHCPVPRRPLRHPPHVLPSSLQIIDRHAPAGREAARTLPAQAGARHRCRARRRRVAHGAPGADRQQRGPRGGRPRDEAGQDALLRFRRPRDVPERPRQHRLRRPRTTWCCTAPAPTTTWCSTPTSNSRPIRSPTRVRWLDEHEEVGALAPLVLRPRRHARIPVQALPGDLRSRPARVRAPRAAGALPQAPRTGTKCAT